MRCIHFTSSGKRFSRTAIAPVNRYAIGHRLREVQRYGHAALCGDADVQPGLAVIRDVHSSHVHGTRKRLDLFQRVVPALECQAGMGGTFRQSSQCLGLSQSIRCHKGAVVVVEIHVFQSNGPGCVAARAAARLDAPDSRRHFGGLVEGRSARLFPDRRRNVSVMGIICRNNCHQ